MNKEYINNLETGRIELHFDKTSYNQLTEDQKKVLKSGYLFSRYISAWISRSTRNHYTALRIAEQLGFTEEEKQGQRLSFEEELEIKADKAERRAERYEYKADKAVEKGESFQSEFNEMRKDWSFVTQPIILGHSGSQRFKRYKDKIMDRYKKGFEEYRKSEYFKDRAETSRVTADMKQLKNPIYLSNRIAECNAKIRKLESNIINYEDKIYRIEQGEAITNYKKELLTVEQYQSWIDETLEKMEYEIDKLAYMENCLDEVRQEKKIYTKEDIKLGYLIKLGHGWAEVKRANVKTITAEYIEHPLKGFPTQPIYAEIRDIKIPEGWTEESTKIKNPFKIGEILTRSNISGNSIIDAYQIVKITSKTITIQKIEIKDNEPIKNKFISEKQERKTVKEDRQNNFVVNDGNWYLYKYTA